MTHKHFHLPAPSQTSQSSSMSSETVSDGQCHEVVPQDVVLGGSAGWSARHEGPALLTKGAEMVILVRTQLESVVLANDVSWQTEW